MKINKDKMWFNAKICFKYVITFFVIAVTCMTFVKYLRGETDITIESLALGILIIFVGSILVTGLILLFSLKDFYDKE